MTCRATRVEEGATLEGMAYDDPIQVVAKLEDRMSGAIGSVTNTSNELGQVAHQVGDLLKVNQERINRIMAQADETSALFQQTVRNANEVFGNPETKAKIQDTLAQVPELMQETRDTVRQLNGTIGLVDRNLQNLDQFTGTLGNQGKGLLEHLNTSAERLDGLMGELLKFSRCSTAAREPWGC